MMAVVAFSAAAAFAQSEELRPSSSLYLQPQAKPDVSLSFGITAEGRRFEPTWGLDLAWINEQNVRKGVNHMGKENVGIGRTSFRVLNPLKDDGSLTTDQIEGLRTRSNLFNNLVGRMLPVVINCDNGYKPSETYSGPLVNTYYTTNKRADVEHWAKVIEAHVAWMKKNTSHPVLGVSPFNEPDNALEKNLSGEIQGTADDEANVARLLKTYDSMQGIVITGGNTLNNDNAWKWFNAGKQYYDWGNTHQLAGSFDTFASFYQQLQQAGKVGFGDEMHNVVEAMVGLEYGMTYGIWWGFDSRARGEFCQISRHGQRLSYGEHRKNWTAASVWRHDDGRVKAFIGSSERQAATTKYQFVSTERDVYYDGYGPVREFMTTLYGGNGYQKGQTNAERVVDVTWGEDVPSTPVTNGTYRLINNGAKKAVAWSGNGSSIVLENYSSSSTRQQWTVKPVTNRSGGDLSFYDVEALDNASIRMNVKNYSTENNAEIIAWTQTAGPTSNEQWYLEYAGNDYYYLRNRESALYLAATSGGDKVVQSTLAANASSTVRNRMLWRLLPADVKYDAWAPEQVAGLTAEAQTAAVTLKWTANAEDDIAGYMVMRAEKGTSDWNTIGRMVTTTQFTDNTCRQGTTYMYKVRAVDQARNRSRLASDEVEATPTGERSLVARWAMEGNLNDETPNMMDAAAYGNVRYADGPTGGQALHLMSNQYVQLPYEVASSDELTVTMWVKVMNSTAWQRIFDFGNDTDHYLFLTPSNGSIMRFAIKNGGDEQIVDCQSKLPTGVWKHVAVTIGQERTVIYVDGEEAGAATGITIRPSDVHPVMNYLGRSQYLADPALLGDYDDVRIYNYAISADDVKTIMNGGVLTGVEGPADTPAQKSVYTLDGLRRKAPQKGLNIIDGKKVVR